MLNPGEESVWGEEAKCFPSAERYSWGSKVKEDRGQSCPHVSIEHLPGSDKVLSSEEGRSLPGGCWVSESGGWRPVS